MTFPITNRSEARHAAQAIVRNRFESKATCAELRCTPHIYTRLAADPLVQHEVQKIMNRTERNSQRFLDLMWDWLESETLASDKAANERKVSAARILAKGYISEKGEKPVAPKMVVDGLAGGMANLTGEPAKKVM